MFGVDRLKVGSHGANFCCIQQFLGPNTSDMAFIDDDHRWVSRTYISEPNYTPIQYIYSTVDSLLPLTSGFNWKKSDSSSKLDCLKYSILSLMVCESWTRWDLHPVITSHYSYRRSVYSSYYCNPLADFDNTISTCTRSEYFMNAADRFSRCASKTVVQERLSNRRFVELSQRA